MKQILPFAVIARHIPPESPLFEIHCVHASMVANKALAAGRSLGLDAESLRFVEEAALLHDIGIVQVNEPKIHCHGHLPYILHGVEGRRILEAEGLPAHARVAENHVGVGVTRQEIVANNLPLPQKDVLPKSIEDKLICWADLFFSKLPGRLWQEKPLESVRQTVTGYGPEAAERFEALHALCSGAA